MQCFYVLFLQADTFLRLQFLPHENVEMPCLLQPSQLKMQLNNCAVINAA
jgi:hypothetical protein